jgi:hypothetical protein
MSNGALKVTTGRRVHDRFKCEIDVVVIHEGKEYPALTDNASLGGLHLIADDRPPFGAIVQLRFRLPSMKAVSICDGTIRWSRPDGFGVQFGSLRPIDVWGLNQYFKTLTPIAANG